MFKKLNKKKKNPQGYAPTTKQIHSSRGKKTKKQTANHPAMFHTAITLISLLWADF